MVLVKRRSNPSSVSTEITHKHTLRLPRGDGRISPTYAISPQTYSPESGGVRKNFTFDSNRQRGISNDGTGLSFPSWFIKVMSGLILISWITGSFYTSRARAAIKDLDYQHQLARIQHEEALAMLKDSESAREAMQKQVNQLQHTQKVLQHEKRVKAEIADSAGGRREPAVMEYLEERQQALNKRIDALQSYIQIESKRDVLEKYGVGPHRVEFTVKFNKSRKQKETFVLQMAPLDHMPHSIHVFLEMVSNKLWDNTLFWRHPGAEHILTSSLANYFTGDTKAHHFEALGLNGVTFSEYSHDFPHEQSTVGFAGRGPIFYINTMDNMITHGPGGQAHHDLPDQADPCFAKVVEGHDVVEKMHQLSMAQEEGGNENPKKMWLEHEVAHIIQARIL